MKKLAFILAAGLLLGACSEEEATPETEVQEIESEVIEVEINPEVIQHDDGSVQFTGETNLPDSGELMFSFSQKDDDGMSQSKAIIENGKFESEKHTSDNGFEPGEYKLSISLSIPTTQSEEFVKAAGKDYENLEGDLMEDAVVGKAMHYEETVTLN